MRGLFFKVFVILWIAQSLIFVISTALIVRHRFDSPAVFFEQLNSSLRNEARDSANSYETGGCSGMRAYAGAQGHLTALTDMAGNELCSVAGAQTSVQGPAPANISGKQMGELFVWSVPDASSAGKQYVFLLSRPHHPQPDSLGQDLLHFAFPQLPVAIVVGGVATF